MEATRFSGSRRPDVSLAKVEEVKEVEEVEEVGEVGGSAKDRHAPGAPTRVMSLSRKANAWQKLLPNETLNFLVSSCLSGKSVLLLYCRAFRSCALCNASHALDWQRGSANGFVLPQSSQRA
jgi:hypothetical protein